MKQQTFLKGAFILMAAGLINRILGFILRVVMVRYLGDEGVGLYSMIYPIYVTFILLSTAGFPVAVSKLVSERNAMGDVRGIDKVFRLALFSVIGMSLLLGVVMVFTSRWIAQSLLSDLRTQRLLLAIAPALVFVAVASTLRSYFQGLRTMTPTAVSQTVEQIVRIGSTMLLVMLMAERGLSYGAAGAACGITLGEFAGMAVLVVMFFKHRVIRRGTDLLTAEPATAPPAMYRYREAFKDMVSLAIPITVGRVILSLMYSLDAMLIPSQLQQAGFSVADATSQFGQLSGIALQVIFLPTVISSALTTSLVPTISDALARNRMDVIRAKYHDVLRITCYIGIPATLFFCLRGNEICNLLFNFADAGPLLALLGTGALFTYFEHVAGGVLNGLGKPHLAVKNTIIGAAFKIGGLLTLVNHPMFGIKGAAISIAAGWIVGACCDFFSIGRLIGFRMNAVHIFLKPLLGTAILYWALPVFDLAGISLGVGERLTTLFTLIVSIVFYLVWMIVVKGLSREDLQKFR